MWGSFCQSPINNTNDQRPTTPACFCAPFSGSEGPQWAGCQAAYGRSCPETWAASGGSGPVHRCSVTTRPRAQPRTCLPCSFGVSFRGPSPVRVWLETGLTASRAASSEPAGTSGVYHPRNLRLTGLAAWCLSSPGRFCCVAGEGRPGT